MKRMIAMMIASTMIFSSTSVVVSAANSNTLAVQAEKTVKVEGLTYLLTSSPSVTTNGTATVYKNELLNRSDVVIPETIKVEGKEYTVDRVSEGAFVNNQSIKTIQIGKNIEKIAENAFLDMASLRQVTVQTGNKYFYAKDGILYTAKKDKIILCPSSNDISSFTIPQTVTAVSDYAFAGNSKLYSLTFGQSLKTIGKFAFSDCSNLTVVNQTNSVESIGDYAFARTNVKSFIFPINLTELGEGTFITTPLTGITLPAKLTILKEKTFYDCEFLRDVKLNIGLKEIGDLAFSETIIEKIEIPANVKKIGYGAFANDKKLSSVKLGEKVQEINDEAFLNCESLPEIAIPKTTSIIGKNVFTGCKHLKSITTNPNNSNFIDKDGILYTKNYKVLKHYPSWKTDPICFLPNSVEQIEENALADCPYILSFEVESGGRWFSTNEDILYNFDQSTLIQFPIAKNASNFTMPNYVKVISSRAFSGALLTGSFNLTSYVEEIGENAFENCINIKEFTVPENNPRYTVINGVLYNKDKTMLIYYPSAKLDISYTIPEGVTAIGDGAFKASPIKEIKLNKSITLIGEQAFMNTAITSIILPSTLVEIDNWAFAGSSIENISIPVSVKKIGSYAFANSDKLKAVTFKNSKPAIDVENNIFKNCKNLSKIYVPNGTYDKYKYVLMLMGIDNFEKVLTENK